jgi:NADPH-dependent ferric siderophore reductase
MTSPDYSIPQVRERIAIEATVLATRQLSPIMQRLTFGSQDFVGQEAISCVDTYMKLILSNPADASESVMRSYTIRRHDSVAGTVDVDFALHGQGGFAAEWAQRAQVGDSATFKGIGGGYNPHAQAPWHLLIGDDSALPAIAAAVDRVALGAPVHVILVGSSREDLLGEAYDLDESQITALRVVQTSAQVLSLVEEAYGTNAGVPHVFLHGEAAMVREVRRVLRAKYEQTLKAMSVSGYWREGASDEQWRDMKRDWSQAVEADEAKLIGPPTL